MKMGGGAKPFGVDAEAVPALVRRLLDAGADWQGFHIFAGSQALDGAAIAETQTQTVALAARLADEIGATPPTAHLGGGMEDGRTSCRERMGQYVCMLVGGVVMKKKANTD